MNTETETTTDTTTTTFQLVDGSEFDSLEAAIEACDDSNETHETVWYEEQIEEIERGPEGEEVVERHNVIIRCPARQPDCIEGKKHDWRTPHELLGGLEEDPGVFSSGPGICSQEVCLCCGTRYVKDEGSSNGIEAGYATRVTYTPYEFETEVVELRRKGQVVAVMDPRKTPLGFYTVHSLHGTLVDALEDSVEDDGFWFAWVNADEEPGNELRPEEYELIDDDELRREVKR